MQVREARKFKKYVGGRSVMTWIKVFPVAPATMMNLTVYMSRALIEGRYNSRKRQGW